MAFVAGAVAAPIPSPAPGTAAACAGGARVAHVLDRHRQQCAGAGTVQIGGVHTTWRRSAFPLVFVLTDLTVRLLGPCGGASSRA